MPSVLSGIVGHPRPGIQIHRDKRLDELWRWG